MQNHGQNIGQSTINGALKLGKQSINGRFYIAMFNYQRDRTNMN